MHFTNRVLDDVLKSELTPQKGVVEFLIPGWIPFAVLASWLISWQVRHSVFAFVPVKDAAKVWNVQILDYGDKKGRISAPSKLHTLRNKTKINPIPSKPKDKPLYRIMPKSDFLILHMRPSG